MKTNILILLLTVLTFSVFSQTINKTSVNGYITDSIQNPLAYATIEILNTDSVLKYGAITDSTGIFQIDSVKTDKYIIKISALGYKAKYLKKNIPADKKSFSLGWIVLKINTELLNEVVVNAHKTGYSVSVDKSEFYPDSSLIKQSKNALDLVGKIPEIHVDKKNDGLKVLGNPNVLMLINGINNGRSLKSIPPEDIERIEIITSPSAKYSSDYASVVNVVLKDKRKQGISIYADLSLCMHQKNHLAFMQISYNYKKLRLFINYNGFFSKMLSLDTTNREENIYKFITLPIEKNMFNSNMQSFQYGFDYIPNKTFLINFTGKLSIEDFINYENSKTIFLQNDTIIDDIYSKNNMVFNDLQQNYSLYLKKHFNKNNSISSTTNIYLLSNTIDVNQNAYSLSNNTEESSINTILSKFSQSSINSKIDYSKIFSDKIKIETGYQFYTRTINNNVSDINGITKMKYIDFRNSVYANSIFKLNKNGIQAGLRFENLNIALYDSIKNNYTKPLPYLSLSHKFNKSNNIRLSYNHRLNYPIYYQLNPYNYYSSDSVSSSSGNPYLKPEISHNLNLQYAFNNNNFYSAISLEYRNVNNIIVEDLFSNNGIVKSKYLNKAKADNYICNFECSFSLFDFFEIDALIIGRYSVFKDYTDHNGLSYYSEIEFYSPLPWEIDLDIDVILFDKNITYNGYESTNLLIDEISLSKDIFNDFTIGFSIWEPFLKGIDKERMWTTTYSESLISEYTNNTCYMFNITYMLDKGKKIKKINHESIMEDNRKAK